VATLSGHSVVSAAGNGQPLFGDDQAKHGKQQRSKNQKSG